MKTAKYALALLAVVVGAYGYFELLGEATIRFGSQEVPEQQPISRLIAGFLLTIVGVVLGVTYRNLQGMKQNGVAQVADFASFFSQLVRSIDLWIGFCAAPLIFALLMESTQGASWPGLIAVALQNGFCCALIADRILASGGSPSTQPPPA